ncbi:MAG: enoyl-CoA hydratase-related protein [Euryarchaeota archaeon]|nr:enoyl-CoA hydratase-related protein [Euryarchaeota archaeon]
MKYELIDVLKDNDIATVMLNRAEVHNAMNERLIKEITTCFKELANDEKTKVIVLTGKGESFCAGADLNWMKSMVMYSKEENTRDSRLLLDMYETIYSCPKPVIGKINGHAFGGGVGLIAVCDINIATIGSKFAFSEVKLGIIPSVISTYVARRIGLSNMKRLFITGERFNSQYAKEIGLIDFVTEKDDFNSTVERYIDQLKSSSPKAIKEIKNLVNNYKKMDIEKYKEFTVEKISELRVSDEGQEGMNAFLEKRRPKWER